MFMIWSSGGAGGYTTGIAISDSGKLADPWKQQTGRFSRRTGDTLFKTFES